jgi:gliding motility-associated lipoprotein GldD
MKMNWKQNRMRKKSKWLLRLWGLSLLLAGCNEYTPKKYGYPKISYPEKSYESFSSSCPFEFQKATYALVEKDTHELAEPCWYNVRFPKFEATLYLSYKHFDTPASLDTLSEQAYRLAMKHNVKADLINETEILDTARGYYGVLYDLHGEAATPFNFYLTDEKNHYIRGSFYFDNVTNSDSILPIYNWLKEDVMHLIRTFEWQN